MASETMVDTNIKVSKLSGAQIGDLMHQRMIVTSGETLGNPELGPTVLEMSCSAANDTDGGTDRQKYESRQKEHLEHVEDGSVVKHRNYEELAERERIQNTDEAQVSSNSTIKFEENEKIREKDGDSKVAEYNAKCEERHETTVSTVEKIGGREFTRRRSISKSFTRTCKRREEMADAPALTNGNTETTEAVESTESSGFEKGPEDDVLIKRSEKTTKSERSSTTITGKGDPSVFDKYEEFLTPQSKQKGALIDLGALGEIKLSTKVSSGENTLEKDFQKSDYLNPDLAGLDLSVNNDKVGKADQLSNGVLMNTEGEDKKSVSTDFFSQVKEHAQERTAAATGRPIYSSEPSFPMQAPNTNINNVSSSSSSSSQKVEAVSDTRGISERFEPGGEQHISMAEQNGHEHGEHVGASRASSSSAAARYDVEDDETNSLPPSFNRRRFLEDSDDEYEPRSLPPPFAPKNRAETDDLIKRILAEAKGAVAAGPGTPRMNGSVSDKTSDSSSPFSSPLTSPVNKSVPSPLTTGEKHKIKVDMGGEKDVAESSSTISSASERSYGRSESSTKNDSMSTQKESMSAKQESMSMKNESTSSKSESMRMKSESMSSKNELVRMESESLNIQSESSKAVGAERKRLSAEEEEMSLFDRRLAKGVEKTLANIFTGDERAKDCEGRNSVESDHSRSSYASGRGRLSAMDQQKSSYMNRSEESMIASCYGQTSSSYDDKSEDSSRKSGREDFIGRYSRQNDFEEQNDVLSKYSRKEKDEFDELDEEIDAWRKNFREQQAKRQRAYMEEAEEAATALVPYQPGRGRLVRQLYTEEDADAYALVPRRAPPPDFIPDEDFIPQRRAETTEIVEERTAEIRTVIDKQGAVLEKLRRASSSFDELTNEIKSLKAQIIENSARRSFLMDDEFDDDEGIEAGPPAPRAGRFSRYPSGSQSFDFSSYTPGSYSSFRQNRLADMDREYSDNISSGESVGLARYRKAFAVDDDFLFNSNSRSNATSALAAGKTNKSRFAGRGLGNFGRSKSLYDDAEADQFSDGDEFEEYKPKARPLPSQEGDQGLYTASVGPGYGSGHGSGDPELGRSSYRSRYASVDDSATVSSSNKRLSYTSRFSNNATSGSSGNGGFRSRLSRANTLSDFDFDRPSSQFDRFSSSTSSSGFTSRFLQKVRDKKKDAPEEGSTGEEVAASKRTKPFKSRFLRASFDSSDFTSKSSSYLSRFKGSTDSSFNAKSSSDEATRKPPENNDSAPSASSDKPEE